MCFVVCSCVLGQQDHTICHSRRDIFTFTFCVIFPHSILQRLRALSRRVHAEAANESDPMPIVFPRTAEPPANKGVGTVAPLRSRKPSSSSSTGRPQANGHLPPKSSSSAAQSVVTAGDLGQTEDGIAQV